MMLDHHGQRRNTVGDYDIHPEWQNYSVDYKTWLKSMTCSDWAMLRIKEIIQKHTPKNQMVLPMIGDFDKPPPPTVPMTILKPKEELWDADPNCEHDVVCAPGGGVKCTKCTGWFCY